MTVLEAAEVVRHYRVGGKTLRAVDGVSFQLKAAGTLAVVGESGCGKSTLARLAALMEPPTAGAISIAGQPAAGPARRTLQLQNQMVFQNPYASLNPRRTVGEALIEPLTINARGTRTDRVHDARQMLGRVGLRPEVFDRYPHQFSGGQRQRVALARALMLGPAVVTADEPVSALDVLGPGPGAEPDARPAGRAGDRLPLHKPRYLCRPPHGAGRSGYVCWPPCRTGAEARCPGPAPAPLYQATACLNAVRGPLPSQARSCGSR